ncbi:MAG: B12-binding domain-containing radical SAM protein, partial [Planctomycetota bacterium]
DQYKKMGIPVVIGGPHVSILPNEASRHCDADVIGEGESVWLDVLSDCEGGKLKSIYGSLNGKYSLDDAPTPAFELLDISKYNRLTVQTSRGCPHRCEFCASSVLLVDGYKQKPIHNVLAEIDKIIDIWKNPFIEFADDNTFVNKEYWKELLTQLKERKVKWFTETDLSVSQDEQLLELMRKSGCAQVLIGFESPNQAALQGVDLRNDWKYNHFGRYKEAIQKIQSHGVTVNGCFVIGLDGHDETIFDQVFEFVKQTGLYEVQVTILTPFPGTPLYERLKDQNRLLEPEAWTKCTLFDLNFEPLNMSQEALVGGFKTLVNKLYDDDFTRWRRDNFKKYLRNNHVMKGVV